MNIEKIKIVGDISGDESRCFPGSLLEVAKDSLPALIDGVERDAPSDKENDAKGEDNQLETDAKFHLIPSSASINFPALKKGARACSGNSSNFAVFSNSLRAFFPSSDSCIFINISLILATSEAERSAR